MCLCTPSLAITEMIMDLHQRINSIKMTVSSVEISDPAKLLCAFQQVTKEVVVSKFLFSATHVLMFYWQSDW